VSRAVIRLALAYLLMTTSGVAGDLEALMAKGQVPGLAMAVIREGASASVTVAGVRSTASGVAVDEHTIFDAASLSKPVFAYAVLQLVDAGVLALDTPLVRHVADYVADDPRAAAITVRMALSHTGGLPNWRNAENPLKTYFPPGERFSYSGEGFIWLQQVVEVVAGEPLDATMQRLVFEPLDMKQSSYVWQSRFDVNYAAPHDASRVWGTKTKPGVAKSAYSLQTTAGDFARFLQAVLAGERLRPETARLWLEPRVRLRRQCIQCLREPQMPEADQRVAWGLGWGLEPETGMFFQWGDNDRGRFKAFAIGSSRDRSAIVVLTNGHGGLSIMPELVGWFMPGEHPSFDWLNYPRYDVKR
jgi:CubicO group peptidase (beta-lactamase class C family)